MAIKKKTIWNLVLIAVILSFFVTPLGYYGKLLLNQVFAPKPQLIPKTEQRQITDYDWRLKDANWDVFNFDRSKGKVVFVTFFASWREPCVAELWGTEKLYDKYKDKVDFYFITNENRPPVKTFMEENHFHFPVTYLIIGDKMPVKPIKVPPQAFLLDKEGNMVMYQEGIGKWNSNRVQNTIEELIAE